VTGFPCASLTTCCPSFTICCLTVVDNYQAVSAKLLSENTALQARLTEMSYRMQTSLLEEDAHVQEARQLAAIATTENAGLLQLVNAAL
jgi:hypothetical protein